MASRINENRMLFNTSIFLEKPNKVLFHPLPNFVDLPVLENNKAKLPNLSLDISLKIKEIVELFPELDKFDQKSAITYTHSKLNSMCDSATDYLKEIIAAYDVKMEKIFDQELNENVIKVYVICFNYFTNYLVKFLSSETPIPVGKAHKSLKKLHILNKFLMMTVGTKNNPIILGQYDVIIIQIINEILNIGHKQLTSHNKFKNIPLATPFLCYQFQILVMLVSMNEGRSFMKVAALDSIKVIYETLERFAKMCFTDPVLKEIYSIRLGKSENWISINNVMIAYAFNRKKFSLIQLGPLASTPQFSLRYIIFYYILKIAQLLSFDDNPIMKERLLGLVLLLVKDGTEFIEAKLEQKEPLTKEELADVEIVLNESLVSANIIKRILPRIADPFAMLEKLGFIQIIKRFIELLIISSLEFGLVGLPEEMKKNEITDCASYKVAKDYIYGVFNFLSKLKNTKDLVGPATPTRIAFKGSKDSFLTLIEEITCRIIEGIDNLKGKEEHLQLAMTYLVEYLFDNRKLISRQSAEYIIKLISSNRFHYTSPKSLEENELELPLEKLTNERICILLVDIIEYERTWAETILQHLINTIRMLLNNEKLLFGLCKLILCGVSSKCLDNSEFYKIIFEPNRKEMNFEQYSKLLINTKSKIIKSFIEIKGINELMNILLNDCHKKNANKKSIMIIEGLFLELAGIPSIAEQIIGRLSVSMVFLDYLKYGDTARNVVVSFVEKLIIEFKYNRKFSDAINEKIGRAHV